MRKIAAKVFFILFQNKKTKGAVKDAVIQYQKTNQASFEN
jgi:hypothetical protein